MKHDQRMLTLQESSSGGLQSGLCKALMIYHNVIFALAKMINEILTRPQTSKCLFKYFIGRQKLDEKTCKYYGAKLIKDISKHNEATPRYWIAKYRDI